MLEPFLTRVTDKIAPDYKCHVQSEMYVNLIKERINNDYYRSQIVKFYSFSHFIVVTLM